MRDADLQVATEGDAGRVPPRPRRPARLLRQVQPPRLHAAAAVRLPGRQGVPAPELPRGRGAAPDADESVQSKLEDHRISDGPRGAGSAAGGVTAEQPSSPA